MSITEPRDEAPTRSHATAPVRESAQAVELSGAAAIGSQPHGRDSQGAGATARSHGVAAFTHPSHFVRGVGILTLAQALTWVGGAAIAIVFPRYLGDVNLGRLTFAWSLVTLVGLVASLGSGSFLTKEVARDPTRAPSLTASALAARLPLSLAAAGLAVLVVHLTSSDAVTRLTVYVYCPLILLDSMGTVVFGTLQGYHWMKAIAIAQVVSKVINSVVVVVVVVRGGGPAPVAAASVITALPGLLAGMAALRRKMTLRASIKWGAIVTVIGGGLPFFVWQASLVVYGQIDFVLLAFMTHTAVVGWYSAAYRVVSIPSFIPTILLMVVFPALSAAVLNRETFDRIARRSLQVVTMLTLPIGLGILFLPDRLISFFGYPPIFWRSAAPLALLALHIPLVGIDMMIGTILNAIDKQRQWAMTGVAAAFLNPLLNLFAIPYTQARFGNGAIGAAAVTTLTEVFMLVVGLVLLPREIIDRTAIVVWLKCLIAGAVMSVVVWFARPLPLPATVIMGGVVYGSCCLAIGALTLRDLRVVVAGLRTHQLSTSTIDAESVAPSA